ncbi:MAG: hypothetical protein NTZ83_04185 [Candidatus Pacearchaeota archaeon]|nr:hypothetical protein [Candidatus Pacearchaeota archaeon]
MALDLTGGVLAFIAGMLVLAILVSIALYIYMGFAYMAIGRKAKLKIPELSWIPGVGPLILAFQASKMHWWPWLLLIGMFIPVVNFIAAPVFMVFAIIWHWKMFEAVKKPGWWAILLLIPIVGLVMVGIAAWAKK